MDRRDQIDDDVFGDTHLEEVAALRALVRKRGVVAEERRLKAIDNLERIRRRLAELRDSRHRNDSG